MRARLEVAGGVGRALPPVPTPRADCPLRPEQVVLDEQLPSQPDRVDAARRLQSRQVDALVEVLFVSVAGLALPLEVGRVARGVRPDGGVGRVGRRGDVEPGTLAVLDEAPQHADEDGEAEQETDDEGVHRRPGCNRRPAENIFFSDLLLLLLFLFLLLIFFTPHTELHERRHSRRSNPGTSNTSEELTTRVTDASKEVTEKKT